MDAQRARIDAETVRYDPASPNGLAIILAEKDAGLAQRVSAYDRAKAEASGAIQFLIKQRPPADHFNGYFYEVRQIDDRLEDLITLAEAERDQVAKEWRDFIVPLIDALADKILARAQAEG